MKWHISFIPHDETGVQVLLNFKGRPDDEEIAGFDVETDDFNSSYHRAAAALQAVAGMDEENGTMEHMIATFMEEAIMFAASSPEVRKTLKLHKKKRSRRRKD